MQLGTMFISNCNNTLHVSDDFCVHPQEHLKTVVTASCLQVNAVCNVDFTEHVVVHLFIYFTPLFRISSSCC